VHVNIYPLPLIPQYQTFKQAIYGSLLAVAVTLCLFLSQGHHRMVFSVAWSPNGHLATERCNLFSSGFDNKVIGWKITFWIFSLNFLCRLARYGTFTQCQGLLNLLANFIFVCHFLCVLCTMLLCVASRILVLCEVWLDLFYFDVDLI